MKDKGIRIVLGESGVPGIGPETNGSKVHRIGTWTAPWTRRLSLGQPTELAGTRDGA